MLFFDAHVGQPSWCNVLLPHKQQLWVFIVGSTQLEELAYVSVFLCDLRYPVNIVLASSVPDRSGLKVLDVSPRVFFTPPGIPTPRHVAGIPTPIDIPRSTGCCDPLYIYGDQVCWLTGLPTCRWKLEQLIYESEDALGWGGGGEIEGAGGARELFGAMWGWG